MKFAIPCLHDSKGVNSSEVVADYYPLKLEEVLAMIQIACHCDPLKNSEAVTQISEIQGRLNQGIMGMTCPFPSEGEIASRCAKIDNLFMRAIEKGTNYSFSTKLAFVIFGLMTFEINLEDVE